jgi:glutamyl-tRNA synthetase
MRGRFAPSPTGPLHIGNLRTALVAYLSAVALGGDFVVRMEDLDPATSSRANESAQQTDLASLGIEWIQPVVRQSERFDRYRSAIAELGAGGHVYRCFCTRREIREAAAAPHRDGLPDAAYPGTCRELTSAQIAVFDRERRPAALRLRTDGERYRVDDLMAGEFVGGIDDLVLQRNDGVPAYNLAVVVDDHEQGITEVVRGDDLLPSTPRQLHVQRLLGFTSPSYGHVPLVVGADGERLAKRHGAVTMADLQARGIGADRMLAGLASSLGLCEPTERVAISELASRFAWSLVPRAPWVVDPDSFDDAL